MSFCGLITLRHSVVIEPINTDTFRDIKCALLTNTALKVSNTASHFAQKACKNSLSLPT